MKYAHLAKDLGEEAAATLHEKTATIVGLGGIGSTLAELLVRSGINVRLVEKDRVFEADMDRLALFTHADITKFKATQAKKILAKINPDVKIKSFNEEITPESLFLLDADIVLNCTDNEELEEEISAYCFKNKIPHVYGAVRDRKCVVVSSTDKKAVHDQLKGLAPATTDGLLPATTHLVAGFMYINVVKLLLGQKTKRGALIYDVWGQHFEDKKGNKK